MNRSTVIIVACGFFFALLAAMAVQAIGGKNKQPAAQTQTTYVLVANKDLKVGEELTMGSTAWAPWPESGMFPGAIKREGETTAAEALKGRTLRAIAKGEPMMKSAMIDNTKSNFVAASLTAGMRAMAINVTPNTSVAGFVTPGDYVDVILTYDVKLPSDEKVRKAAMPVVTKLAAETILEKLRVLATDQSTNQSAEAKVTKTVTVEVDPRQAELLTLAAKMGTLSLVLRSIGDEGTTHDSGQTLPVTTDMRASGVMREIMKGENKSGRLSQVVRVYNGTRVENVEVRPYVQ